VVATSLSGRVPASFDDLELESFLVNGTGVCVPPSLAEWLDSIAETDDPPECASRVVVEPAVSHLRGERRHGPARGDGHRCRGECRGGCGGDVEEPRYQGCEGRRDGAGVGACDRSDGRDRHLRFGDLRRGRGGGQTVRRRPHGARGLLPGDGRRRLERQHQLDERRTARGVVRGRHIRERPGQVPGAAKQQPDRRIPAEIGLLDSLFSLDCATLPLPAPSRPR